MTTEQLVHVLKKTAAYVDSIEAQNEELKRELRSKEIATVGGDGLRKLASDVGMSPDELVEAVQSLKGDQRRLFEKLSANDNFSLGEVSDEDGFYEPTADDKLRSWLEN